jgi:gamma-glutamylcyclotransferase (GGCT)/AIG2-like uncharacterized protein YtfP
MFQLSMSPSLKHWTVFVYGTLKRGEPNHHWLSNPQNGFQEFLGAARMVRRFPLVIASRYNVPYLLDIEEEGKGEGVLGEVYRVDCSMLAKLDELEDHPRYYRRREELVTMMHDGQAEESSFADFTITIDRRCNSSPNCFLVPVLLLQN